jgi:hypothetical protein
LPFRARSPWPALGRYQRARNGKPATCPGPPRSDEHDLPNRLSRISTAWSVVFDAHRGVVSAVTAAQELIDLEWLPYCQGALTRRKGIPQWEAIGSQQPV